MPAATGRNANQCLIDSCSNAARFRGLCQRCYKAARRAIAAGLTTEAELAERHMLLPSARGRRPVHSPFNMQLEKRA